jgi:non-ribosomal peptide synthetase component E (peptide arylation enzyme)
MSEPLQRLPGVVYPPPEICRDYVARGVLGDDTLAGAICATVRSRGEAIAISGGAASLSYAELDRLSNLIAAGLLRSGLMPLDSVLFQLPNGPDLVTCFVACLKAGLIPVCTLLAHRENEIVQIGRQVGARAHLVPAQHGSFDYLALAARCREALPGMRVTLTTAIAEPRDELGLLQLADLAAVGDTAEAQAALAAVQHDPWQVAVYQLSGGTTGTPKVIPRFQNDYLCNLRGVIDRLDFKADDRMLVFLPMMHNASFICTWGSALLVGAEIVAVDGLVDPKSLVQAIMQRQPTWSIVAEVVLARTRNLPDAAALWRSFRGLMVPGNAAAIEQMTGVRTHAFFGMTEGVIFFAGEEDPQAVRHTTLGHPICADDRFRILDPDSELELADGEVGEMVIRGPYTLHGYFDAADRNREAFTSDGWYRSGDLMSAISIDGRRCVRFHGRLKDVIDRGGEKINALEVEMALMRFPGVAAAAVVPMPDPVYGERTCAFIVPVPPGPGPTLDDLRRHFEALGMAKFKWPERVELVDALPMTAAGKLAKLALQARIRAQLQAEGQAGASA